MPLAGNIFMLFFFETKSQSKIWMCTCSDLSSQGWLVQRNCWGRETCIYPPNLFAYKFNNGRLLRLPMLVLNNYILFFPPDFPNIDCKFLELVRVNLMLYKTNTITNRLQTSLQINTCQCIFPCTHLLDTVSSRLSYSGQEVITMMKTAIEAGKAVTRFHWAASWIQLVEEQWVEKTAIDAEKTESRFLLSINSSFHANGQKSQNIGKDVNKMSTENCHRCWKDCIPLRSGTFLLRSGTDTLVFCNCIYLTTILWKSCKPWNSKFKLAWIRPTKNNINYTTSQQVTCLYISLHVDWWITILHSACFRE